MLSGNSGCSLADLARHQAEGVWYERNAAARCCCILADSMCPKPESDGGVLLLASGAGAQGYTCCADCMQNNVSTSLSHLDVGGCSPSRPLSPDCRCLIVRPPPIVQLDSDGRCDSAPHFLLNASSDPKMVLTMVWILATCCLALAVNWCSFGLIGKTSPTTFQVCQLPCKIGRRMDTKVGEMSPSGISHRPKSDEGIIDMAKTPCTHKLSVAGGGTRQDLSRAHWRVRHVSCLGWQHATTLQQRGRSLGRYARRDPLRASETGTSIVVLLLQDTRPRLSSLCPPV